MKSRVLSGLNIHLFLSVLICCLVSTVLNKCGLKFRFGEMHLEIIQKMTACISCILCCQDTSEISKKAGINRIIITLVGGLTAIVVILLNLWCQSDWLMAILVPIGVIAAFELCKMTHVPPVTARIGAVTFVLVACTLSGTARIWYAVFRLISTVFAAVVVYLVSIVIPKQK